MNVDKCLCLNKIKLSPYFSKILEASTLKKEIKNELLHVTEEETISDINTIKLMIYSEWNIKIILRCH